MMFTAFRFPTSDGKKPCSWFLDKFRASSFISLQKLEGNFELKTRWQQLTFLLIQSDFLYMSLLQQGPLILLDKFPIDSKHSIQRIRLKNQIIFSEIEIGVFDELDRETGASSDPVAVQKDVQG
ncbi:hypothetical protein HAX54_011221 [Datura stramonium]|uniref:Uncharacterized protein n=1 Tax=Datura stramonium TaxID=4076 RepID=A0ABS8TJ39_DATST|nr:hypothetical protein [Datura stramonium]